MAKYSDLQFNNGEYVNQYAGIPLQEIQHTADQLSQRHYANLANATQLGILANQMKSKLLPGAKDYVDNHINSIDSALQDMAKNGGENSTARIHALASSLQGNQGILNGLQRAKEYADETNTINELIARGEDPVWNKQAREALLNATPDSDLYQSPYQSTAQKRLDYLKKQDEVLDPLKPDAWEGELKAAAALAGTSVPNFLKSNKFQGLTSKKVQDYLFKPTKDKNGKVVDGLGWTSYKDTPEYRQQKMVGMSDDQIKAELQSRGEAKVFSQYAIDYIHNPEADNVTGTTPPPDNTVKTPLPATIRQKFDLPFNANSINEEGNVELSIPAALLKGPASGVNYPAVIKDLEREADTQTGSTKQFTLDRISKLKEEQDMYSKTKAEYNKEKTKQATEYARAMLELMGHDTENMTDDQVKKMNGAGVLTKKYVETYLQDRLHSPFINNIVDEKTRQANEDFMRGNISQAEIIDMQTGKHYSGIKDENGETPKEILPLTKAIADKKAIMEGTVDPKHVLTTLDNAGENFTRARRIQVPDENGQLHEYLVGQLPGTTSVQDINENVLYNKATQVPGNWGQVNQTTQILSPASQGQKDLMWKRYGLDSGLTKEQWDSNEIVLLKEDGKVRMFPNYTTAAMYTAQKGKLKLK